MKTLFLRPKIKCITMKNILLQVIKSETCDGEEPRWETDESNIQKVVTESTVTLNLMHFTLYHVTAISKCDQM